MIIMAPNAVRLLKYVGKIVGPSPRLKRRVSQKYSELIKQGIFKRVNSESGSRIELTEKGKRLAEQLAQTEELRPKKQKKWDRKWRIIMFDVWERRRVVRDDLRDRLVEMGFVKLQDSVWVYPYPCEKMLLFLRAHLRLGKGILYIVADEIEQDDSLRKHFGLPLE
ncbi:MAG: Transcriptional regulator, PaaX family [Parcubacteria group bacterium GW2011_GWA2_47_12]|nr:MAG: Transcriptional regulator, PaaX family [Parcubacteria group bacterium GW2011_GWA2_47_12]